MMGRPHDIFYLFIYSLIVFIFLSVGEGGDSIIGFQKGIVHVCICILVTFIEPCFRAYHYTSSSKSTESLVVAWFPGLHMVEC